MESGNDSRAIGAGTLPLILHEFPIFAGINTIDNSLSLAAVKAIERNDMVPMIKHELKNRINFKRMAEGKEELMVDFSEKPKAELTTEEKMKVERRREQNRMAARRFREKHNTLGTKLQKITQSLESDNTSLRNQLRELRRERAVLQCQLQEHLSVCPYVTGRNMHMRFPS